MIAKEGAELSMQMSELIDQPFQNVKKSINDKMIKFANRKWLTVLVEAKLIKPCGSL